jgi:hypothetical protein
MTAAFGASGSGTIVRISILVIVLAVLAFAGATAHAAGCSKQAIDQAADATAVARQALLDLPIGDPYDPDVSLQGKRAIIRMKVSLAQLVEAYMACNAPGTLPATIVADLSQLARRITPPASARYNYGYDIDFEAREPASAQAVILVSVSFNIVCQNDDSLLFVFSAERDGWREILQWPSQPYDAFGGLGLHDSEFSPPDEIGRWYLLVDSIPVGCAGTWSSIQYTVLRPLPGTLNSRTVYDDVEPIYWAAESAESNSDFGKLTAARDWFDVRFHAYSIDVGVHDRLWIRHFAIQGDKVTRIQPVAESPRDFVDEWIVSSWTESSAWTAPAVRTSLRRLHDHLAHYRDGIGSFQYESIRSCAGRRDWTQIEVSSDEKNASSYFFGVAGSQPFRMISASRQLDPLCQGEDQLHLDP